MQVKSIADCSKGSILPYFIKLSFAIKIFVLSIFECRLKTGYTVVTFRCLHMSDSSNQPAHLQRLDIEDLTGAQMLD